MARVNVFIKAELLNEINKVAKDEGTNRSSLIQTAL
jgi:metal-responsive CopG/Arc/MetJ family transcriptional regulator